MEPLNRALRVVKTDTQKMSVTGFEPAKGKVWIVKAPMLPLDQTVKYECDTFFINLNYILQGKFTYSTFVGFAVITQCLYTCKAQIIEFCLYHFTSGPVECQVYI